jgi:hypothetical protein
VGGKLRYSSPPPEPSPIEGEGNAGHRFGHKPLRCKHWQRCGERSAEWEMGLQDQAARQSTSQQSLVSGDSEAEGLAMLRDANLGAHVCQWAPTAQRRDRLTDVLSKGYQEVVVHHPIGSR